MGDVCDPQRACHGTGFCSLSMECIAQADDTLCTQADANQCSERQCVRDLNDQSSDIDVRGCRLVPRFGPNVPHQCITDDPCVVSTVDHPTFCNPITFHCEGGTDVECADGSECRLGACVLLDCQGDDDDCYRPDDDGHDDDNGLNNWDDWWPSIIVAIIILLTCCFCSILWAFYVDGRRRREPAQFRRI